MRERDSRALIEARIPEGARRIIEKIVGAGGRVCLVGGSLRDLLLGSTAKDWDFATDLLPERVRSLFPRSISVGARFGTTLIVEQDGSYEVTTFRKDGQYSDARHPDTVTFTSSLEEDLGRRDFTINAIAYCMRDRRLVDPHGGRDDLARKTVRCVGRSEERFREDALRMLRCVRIAGQLGFAIEDETFAALVRCAPMLDAIARERVREEFDRILAQQRPSTAIDQMMDAGVLERFLPELAACYGVPQNRFHAFDIYHHTLFAVDQTPADKKIVRLAALFHDLGKVDTRREAGGRTTFYNHQVWSARKADEILRRLRYPNDERERVVHLVQQHMFHYSEQWTDAAIRRFIRTVGVEHLEDLFAVRAADTLGNGLRKTSGSPELLEMRRRINRILEEEAALSVRDLKVGGDDLMERLDLGEGPWIGAVLRALLEEVLEDPSRNEPDTLMELAKRLLPAIETKFPPRREGREK